METFDELKKKSKQKFSLVWLSDDRYKSWIRQTSDDTLYLCTIYNKAFFCSSRVFRHADSACHRKNNEESFVHTDNNVYKKRKHSTKENSESNG